MDNCLIEETENLNSKKLMYTIYCVLLWITPIIFISLLSNLIKYIIQIEQILYVGGVLSSIISMLSYIGIGIVISILISNFQKKQSLVILGGILFGWIYSFFGMLIGCYIIEIPYFFFRFMGSELGFGYLIFGIYSLLLYRNIESKAGDKNEEN